MEESKNTDKVSQSRLIELLGLTLAVLMITGCGTDRQVDAVIIKVVDDKSKMGCVGVDKRTIVRTAEGFTSTLCGEYGQAGDKVRGYWREGSLDATQNGFRFKP
jgi:hypothetical protein